METVTVGIHRIALKRDPQAPPVFQFGVLGRDTHLYWEALADMGPFPRACSASRTAPASCAAVKGFCRNPFPDRNTRR